MFTFTPQAESFMIGLRAKECRPESALGRYNRLYSNTAYRAATEAAEEAGLDGAQIGVLLSDSAIMLCWIWQCENGKAQVGDLASYTRKISLRLLSDQLAHQGTFVNCKALEFLLRFHPRASYWFFQVRR